MNVRPMLLAAALLTTASPGLAQQREPIGRFVVDLRLASSGLPTEAGWTPLLPANTVVPSRGLGLDVGAHVNVLRRRAFAVGVGATWLMARGSTSPPEPADGAPPTAAKVPSVITRVTSLAPQVSLNFGHSLGWSYLSAGLGRARVDSEATLAGGNIVFAPQESGWVGTINFGGGARWFLNDRVGVGFDVRWHRTSSLPATATHPGAGRASLLVAGAGLVVK
jgi:hypothetical protein